MTCQISFDNSVGYLLQISVWCSSPFFFLFSSQQTLHTHRWGESRRELKEKKTPLFSVFIMVAIMSGRQVPFYGLIQQQNLWVGFWASQGHSWWNYWDPPPFITAWHVSCSRFWCRKVTAEDGSLSNAQPSKTTSCVRQTEEVQSCSNCSPTWTQLHRWNTKLRQGFCANLFMKLTKFQPPGVYSHRNTT